MESKLKDKLRRLYRMVKFRMKNSPLDFEEDTLPWIDRSDANIDAFVKTFKTPKDFPYDLAKLLRDWRDNGYVILEKAIPPQWLDNLWQEVEEVVENNEKYSVKSLVYQFNDGKETPVKEVPKEKLRGIGSRLLEYHNSSIGAKKVMTHPHLATFLEAVFNEKTTVFQSLIFKYGSQQGTHQDYPWVRSKIASHLAAAWIPLEDVSPDSGPLVYYPGSHRLPKFDFGTGILFSEQDSFYTPDEFTNYLNKTCAKNGIKGTILLLKKGDVLLWHGALAHGGSRINKPELTRKSFVCHYSTLRSYPKHRFEEGEKSIAQLHNGITIYANPTNLAEEDVMTAGKEWN
ncbi:phytanoyl-CoA dioxygenase family protein [Larkinella sp.]|uniref:phytanoyl-CoA dioxygenase family protein n=1 Tax=Larkinella sp. TaxID=2034517 RepID=UPI003BAC89DB